MKFYEVYNHELETYIKYKILSPADAVTIKDSLSELAQQDYVQEVMNRVVFNMHTDISPILRDMPKKSAESVVNFIYLGAVMLNPALDIDAWTLAAYTKVYGVEEEEEVDGHGDFESETDLETLQVTPIKKIPRAKILGLEAFLKEKVIGQDRAIGTVVNTLKRYEAGLGDDTGPLGVFLFSGASGVGKSYLAKEIHNYLFPNADPVIRIDCGEYQQKHDAHKLIGAPPSYVGHDDGGQLTNRVINSPNSVILLDEVEKAHPNVWDIFLRVFEDGVLTDSKGREIDFSNTIVILTTNLGNDKVSAHLTGKQAGFGSRIESTMGSKQKLDHSTIERYANEAIKAYFRTELLNRISKIVVFDPLQDEHFFEIADQCLNDLDRKLSKKGYVLNYDELVTKKIANEGSDSISNARGILKFRKDIIDDLLTEAILGEKLPRGTIFSLIINDVDKIILDVVKPKPKRKKA